MKITKYKDGRVVYSSSGFLSSIGNAIKRGFNSIFNRRGTGIAGMLGSKEVIHEYDQDKAINEGFSASTWIYAIIAKNAKKFASIPRYLYDEKKLMQEKDSKNPYQTKAVNAKQLFESDLNQLLVRPNEYQGRAQFLCMLYAFYLACGEAFIWLNRGDVKEKLDENGYLTPRSEEEISQMPVLEMYVLPTNYVKVYTDPDNLFGVKEYCLEVVGRKIPIRKVDIIHWKDLNLKFDPISGIHLRGMTRLTPGSASMTENKEITKGTIRYYKNDGSRGILHTKGVAEQITAQQESDIRSVVNAKINDNDMKGAVALLTGLEWDYIDLARTAAEMTFIEGRASNAKELCALFDTPYLLFIPTEATLANLENAKKNWVNDVIIPATKELDDLLNLRLLKSFDLVDKAKIISDFTELPEMQQDMGAMVTAMMAAWPISPNRKLIAWGYEAIDNPLFDEPWVPGGMRPLSKMGAEDDGYEEQLRELEKRGINR